MQVKFKKLHPNAITPSYAHPGEDAGLDMVCTEIRFEDGFVAYETGISVEIPQGYVGYLFPRSSNCRKDLLLTNSVGVVDSGYRGLIEFRYKSIKHGIPLPEEWYKGYTHGDKVGQLIIMPYPIIEPIEVEGLSESKRGTNGYGSSDKQK